MMKRLFLSIVLVLSITLANASDELKFDYVKVRFKPVFEQRKTGLVQWQQGHYQQAMALLQQSYHVTPSQKALYYYQDSMALNSRQNDMAGTTMAVGQNIAFKGAQPLASTTFDEQDFPMFLFTEHRQGVFSTVIPQKVLGHLHQSTSRLVFEFNQDHRFDYKLKKSTTLELGWLGFYGEKQSDFDLADQLMPRIATALESPFDLVIIDQSNQIPIKIIGALDESGTNTGDSGLSSKFDQSTRLTLFAQIVSQVETADSLETEVFVAMLNRETQVAMQTRAFYGKKRIFNSQQKNAVRQKLIEQLVFDISLYAVSFALEGSK